MQCFRKVFQLSAVSKQRAKPEEKSSAPIHEEKPALIKVPKNASAEPSMKASRVSTPKKPLHTPNLQKKVTLLEIF